MEKDNDGEPTENSESSRKNLRILFAQLIQSINLNAIKALEKSSSSCKGLLDISNLLKGKNTYQETMSTIYYEMSKNFTVAVDILLDISEQTTNQNNERSILSLYDAWLNTASPKLEKELFHRGVNPIKVSTRKV